MEHKEIIPEQIESVLTACKMAQDCVESYIDKCEHFNEKPSLKGFIEQNKSLIRELEMITALSKMEDVKIVFSRKEHEDTTKN